MKCPRNKFADIDYSQDVDQQKKQICAACSDNNGKQWGQHCGATLYCLVTGEQLPQSIFQQLPKEARRAVTHSLSEQGRKQLNERLERLKKKRGRFLW